MKNNTLLVSVLAGLGSIAALFAIFSTQNVSQYSPREVVNSGAQSMANNEFFTAMRKNVNTGKVEASDYIKAAAEVNSRSKSRATSLNWEFSGPDNVGGRVRGIVIDKDDANKVYAGAIGGGMYVSTDAAGTWTYKSDNWANILVSAIVQDGNGRVYVGTGDDWSNLPGGGIWVSDDRGETFTHLSSTTPGAISRGDEWAFVNRIAVSKNKNAQGNYTVYAGTGSGLKVSVDNGLTWTSPFTTPSPSCAALNGNVQDVITTKSNRVYISYNGELYISDAGETSCSYKKVGVANGIGNSARMSLAVCDLDENMMYAFQAFNGASTTFQILSSQDAGENWGPLQPAPPTAIIDSTFDLMGSNPATYNQAIVVDPTNCDRIYVGAVSMFRVAGSWSSVAVLGGGSRFSVHADKHWFAYSPHDANTMYVGSDGGVAKTTNAAASTVFWSENNRHFGTTQYYGVAFTPQGYIMGGSQDNGNQLINPSVPGNAGKDAVDLFTLGDGFDCQASNIGSVAFVTSQFGNVGRDSYLPGASGGNLIHSGGAADGSGPIESPFISVLRLWESTSDLTSKDSVVFRNDSNAYSIGSGDGIRKVYSGTLRRDQPSAKIVPGQVRFEDVAGTQIADDSDVNGVLKSFGDSVGTIDYNTGAYSIRWAFAPPVGSLVNSNFNVKYDAGDSILLVSQNEQVPFSYILPNSLNVNDSIKVQDPVQSLLAVSMNNGVDITREGLYFPRETPKWISVRGITPTSMEFSNDGNVLYLGGYNGSVYRISGLNELYTGVEPDSVLTYKTIFNGSTSVSGINIHPTDPEKLLVTTGGYGALDHVYELTQAESSNGISPKRNLQGDLPDFPVYDPEYNINNTDQVLIGTELGLWVSDDVSGSVPTWTQQSAGIGNVRVVDVRQQRLPYYEASNFGRFYLGTFGRGIWTSGDLVSVEEPWAEFNTPKDISNIKMYPNPVQGASKLSFDMPNNGAAQISIFDISGKLIQNQIRNFSEGTAVYDFNASSMPAGTYFVTVTAGDVQGHAKFIVVK
tara:strand:- start:140816 stop:143893 length:3078 start_codon:yes stop_codon:yes gene_type:complete